MKQIIIRTLNLLLIAGILFSYQKYAVERDQIVSAHEKEEKEAKALEKKYQKMITQAQADAEAASGDYKDGTYEGRGKGYGGDIKVKITVEDGEISQVEVTSHKGEDDLYYSLAEELLTQIVDEQTADLDGISGATYSSKGILDAAKDALKGAKK